MQAKINCQFYGVSKLRSNYEKFVILSVDNFFAFNWALWFTMNICDLIILK